LDRAALEKDGSLVRFDPAIYALLQQESTTFLPARACYHFADRIPLPWFSVLTQDRVTAKPAAKLCNASRKNASLKQSEGNGVRYAIER
jgi:hypothetical protein